MAGSTAPEFPDGNRPPGTPRWVKLTAIVVVVLAVAVVLVLLLSGGDHGPGRHLGQPTSAARVLTW